MRQMPGVMPQGFFNAWPEDFHSFVDKVGQAGQPGVSIGCGLVDGFWIIHIDQYRDQSRTRAPHVRAAGFGVAFRTSRL